MIVIAIGSNLPAAGCETPLATCEAAVRALESDPDVRVLACGRWYESEPVPQSDQPWFVNGVVAVATTLAPETLLSRLHAIEASFGRVRRARNEARPLDLDLIDYDGLVREEAPSLPHPRMRQRAFVLRPFVDLAERLDAAWRHPETGESLAALVAALPAGDGVVRPIAGGCRGDANAVDTP